MKYKTLPIVLKDQKLLLLGGGPVALQKAEVLQRNSIKFEIISLEYIEAFQDIHAKKSTKAFELEDTQGYSIIIDATGSKEVMEELLTYKQTHNFLYNCVDVPEVCDFFFAALIERGALKVAVSSAGASPTLAQVVRDKIKSFLPNSLEALTDKLQAQRDAGLIDIAHAKTQTRKALAKVSLVGCGTGDVELLTIKAYRTIQEADVVFIDHLISEEIKEIIPETTLKISVGKQKGAHSVKQEKINEMLLDYASKGLHIARLKAGDPYIFGRGAEEAIALSEEGIEVEVIAGISSAIAAPQSAGIAPTARGYATNLSIVSAHLAGNSINTEWIPLLEMKNHTTIVLMGVSRAKEIQEHALSIGIDENMPVAIISNATRENQSSIYTTLKDLPQHAKNAPRPALLVFGKVVELHTLLPHYNSHKDETHEKTA